MTRDEAHARLDALRDGREQMTDGEIRDALLATGDLCRRGKDVIVVWPFKVSEPMHRSAA